MSIIGETLIAPAEVDVIPRIVGVNQPPCVRCLKGPSYIGYQTLRNGSGLVELVDVVLAG